MESQVEIIVESDKESPEPKKVEVEQQSEEEESSEIEKSKVQIIVEPDKKSPELQEVEPEKQPQEGEIPEITVEPQGMQKDEMKNVEIGQESEGEMPQKVVECASEGVASVAVEKPSDKCEFNPNELYKCRFCGLQYMYLMTLKAHERVHNVESPYVCTKCGDSFRFYSEMEYHMLGHQGQKVYKCQCGRGFYRYTDLLYHKHPGEDDEEPEEGATFKTEHPLKVYSEVSKPYMCQYCGKGYANSRDLKFHIYSHRGERAFVVASSRYLITRADP